MGTKIRARIVGEESALGAVDTVTVLGCALSRDFSEHEVSDAVLAKLKGNPFVEVQVKRLRAEPGPASDPAPVIEPSVDETPAAEAQADPDAAEAPPAEIG